MVKSCTHRRSPRNAAWEQYLGHPKDIPQHRNLAVWLQSLWSFSLWGAGPRVTDVSASPGQRSPHLPVNTHRHDAPKSLCLLKTSVPKEMSWVCFPYGKVKRQVKICEWGLPWFSVWKQGGKKDSSCLLSSQELRSLLCRTGETRDFGFEKLTQTLLGSSCCSLSPRSAL